MTNLKSTNGTHDKVVNSLIAAGLEGRILLPQDPDYSLRNDSYYSNSSKLNPSCILRPQSADDVARAVKTLAAGEHKFAVRSGGCNFWPSNNIDGGVTIDLGLLDTVQYHKEEDTVSIGPGARWGQVYEYLQEFDRTVGGGRETSVGVGGLVLSGGNNLFSGRYGLTCDQVVELEVVLASGDIVIAREGGDHEDLLVGLRGGGSNFGVVTKITMQAIPIGPVWGGGRVFSTDVIKEAADSFVDITNNIAQDPDTAIICIVANLEPGLPPVIASLCVNLAGVENPPILDRWLKFPTLLDLFKKKTSLLELMATTKQRPGYHCIWFTLTFRNSASIMLKAVELHKKLNAKLDEHILDKDYISQCCFQPLPRYRDRDSTTSTTSNGDSTHRPRKKKKNVLGHETQLKDHDGILWTGHVSVRTAEQEKWAYQHVREWYEGIRDFAESEGGLLPWIPANYADPAQKVLQSYGPENVRFIREVANRYDPAGVFQTLCPGGFKVSAVEETGE